MKSMRGEVLVPALGVGFLQDGQERSALQLGIRLGGGKVEQGGRQVDEADQGSADQAALPGGGMADQPIYSFATLILLVVLIYVAYTWLSSKPKMISDVFGRTLDMLTGAFEGFLG